MSVSKQAKTLTAPQITAICRYLEGSRNGKRNLVIFLLSVKAGLRAKEIAHLSWSMVLNSDGKVGSTISLQNSASKGRSGRVIPLNKALRQALESYFLVVSANPRFDSKTWRVVRTERSKETSPQVIVNMFQNWYRELGYSGCSSHSGRRTMITNAAKKISLVGGSLRDVQLLAGHSSLQTTQRYIDYDTEAQRKVIEML